MRFLLTKSDSSAILELMLKSQLGLYVATLNTYTQLEIYNYLNPEQNY